MLEDYGLNNTEIERLASDFESRTAQETIEWAINKFKLNVALITSFQVEGMVILDMVYGLDPSTRVITIDTGRLPEKTYHLIDQVEDKYCITVEVISPDRQKVQDLTENHGVNPFYRSVELRLACCNIRKVLPMEKALSGLGAWMSGIRRSQSVTRANVKKIELDSEHDTKIKINPLADWTNSQVWTYIKDRDIPYNDLYNQGYTSIGCAPCTRPISQNEDPRAGRWWWESGVPKECGIHIRMNGVMPVKDIDPDGKSRKL